MILTNHSYYTSNISSPDAPILVIALLSFCIGLYFMEIYGTTVDTLGYVYCVDEEENNGQAIYAPYELKEFMSK